MSPERLKILHIGKFYPPFMGGIENHLRWLCSGLQKAAEVEALTANRGPRDSEESVDGLKVTRVGTMFELFGAPVCPGLVRKIRETPCDLLHIHLPNPSAVLAYLVSRAKAPLVVTYHSDIVRQKILGPLFQPFLRKFLGRCAAVIVTSPSYLDTSPALSPFREICRVIPHGIPVERFQQVDADRVSRIRKEHGTRIVLSVGRLVYYKGFEYLIRAMAKVRGRLLIVGAGPLRLTLERESKNLGASGRVIFLGEVEDRDVIPYYHAAEVFVLPSVERSEAFGIVQLEAMACGKPVVNTRIDSGVAFVSLDGVTGFTVPPRDPEALAQAINRLLDDPVLRQKFGEAARRRVEQEFRLDLMVERTLRLYHEVLKGVGKRPQQVRVSN